MRRGEQADATHHEGDCLLSTACIDAESSAATPRARAERRAALAAVASEWALEDIEDVRRYVGQVVVRHFGGAAPDQIEETIAEGIAIVLELHGKWRPADCESFAKLCSTYLLLRLIDFWRRDMRQRNICRRNGRSGEYVYSGVTSLSVLAESGMELAAAADVRVGD